MLVRSLSMRCCLGTRSALTILLTMPLMSKPVFIPIGPKLIQSPQKPCYTFAISKPDR
ncbi:Uncharacterised protein [Vibrio cholerae]|nr:Uncharacterised protein [Vibrio cholerae]CSC78282.1 Uncharacterised protein [Vibrio cholerae]